MFRSTARTLMVLICLPLMVSLHALGQYDPSQIMNALQHRQPGLTLVTSHRGELNGPYAQNMPENSVGSALNAIYGGIELIEADVWTTQDHIPYLAHDKTTYRMLNMQGRGYFNPDPNGTPAVNWSDISGKTLCAGRGITDVAYGGSGQCTLIYDHVQTQSSLAEFMIQVAPATNAQGQPWGGIVLLDIRDQDSLVQSWTTLVNSPSTPNQVVFKFSPLVLGLNSVQDLVNLLAASPYYHGQTGNVEHDLAAYMNLQPTYITNLALKQETVTGDPNWAINDWNNNWLANAGQFHRLLTAEVSVKGSPGEFMTADTLYQTVTSGPLNAISMYSTYYECFDPTGPQNLPNKPPGSTLSNGYWINNGLCNTLNPSVAESADGIDHRYDYNFITGHTSPNTPNITNPPNFGMIIADNAFVLIDYLNGVGQRNLRSIQPHCNSGSAYPDCDASGQTTYTLCTTEGGTCTFTGDRNVVIGANGAYSKPVTFANRTACTVSAFNQPDPLPGVVKACYYSSPISNYPASAGDRAPIYCSDEGQPCNWTEPPSGAYEVISADGNYKQIAKYVNGFQCANSTFADAYSDGDPAPGFVKACFYSPAQQYIFHHYGPQGYSFCAGEGGVCAFKGPGRIAYGSGQNFGYKVFDGGVACNNSVFTDTNPGYTKDCWYETTTAASLVAGVGTGSGTGACDIYASGGTPCVAAHSTVRALFSHYSGKLYQVKRASDGTTSDIGTLATGGYANAAGQDSFCASTTCTITMIYDQTSQHNDLAIEGGGGAAPAPDSGAVANALPVTVNGNKVYGVKVTPGVGYRNNATSGVARGASPEGMYMVTSGTYVNSGCCFDYGNAETNSQDTGNGHMDALNFGTWCGFAPCSGSGPWVQADLENGQYMGNGSNTGDQSLSTDFVTAMLKNDGRTTFALKGGNGQSGGLTTEYSGSLPTVRPGYTPMSLEGAIVLGTGGDNSNASLGSFFEGAMTSGYPTDAAENAVQANIVAAGYAGDSSGGSGGGGGTGVVEPSGPYTGPSDPGGSGPQDGFASPAAEQLNVVMATKPALASFNGNLYVAFEGVNVNNDLYVTSSSSGNNFPTATQYTNLQSSSAPALAAYNGQLFMAFRGLNVNNDFYITSSPTGSNFPTATQHTNIQMGGAPALAVFNNQLYAAFQANDPSHTLHITSSSDGVSWPTAWDVPNVKIGSDPAMAVFNGMLYVAFRADDPGNDVWIASSPDGVNFSSQKLTGQTMDGYSSPALVVSNDVLYYIYEANDQGHEMLVTASGDGATWQGPAAYLGVQMGAAGPGAAAFANGAFVGFQSNDSRNVLFVTNKVTEASSYTGPTDGGSGGLQDGFTPTAAIQPNDIMGSKPALAAFKDRVYAAFEGVGVNNDLYVTSSPTGSNFPTATQYTNIRMSSAPALAQFNNQLYVAFRGLGVNNDLYVTSSPTGSNFPTATQHTNIQIGGAPAMALFNNQLYIAFQANDAGHTLHVTSSSDGVNWPDAWQIPNVKIGSDPAMAVFNGLLYIAFRADDPSNDVWIASSSDGVNFTSQKLTGQTMAWGSSPALAVVNQNDGNYLYYVYEANDSSHEMLVSTTTDGTSWQNPALYSNINMGATGPAATGFGNTTYVGFQSNDARNVLFVTSQPVSGNTASAGLYVPNSTFYPRMVQLSHGSSATNGNIVASTDGNIFVNTNNGAGFTFTGTVPSQYGYHLGSGTLYEMPQTVGSLQAGTLLYAATYYYGSGRNTAIEVNTSTDGGHTWNYSSMPVSGAGFAGHGFWEPQFTVANDGALVMFWSDETDSCCSQKLSQIRTYNGTSWQDRSNTVASGNPADRPGMAVVSKLPSGVYFMSYELCGPASCTAVSRTSTDGWNFGDPGNTGTKVQTASGQYFQHAPTNVWSPSVLGINGALLLIGQQMFDSTGAVDPNSGSQMFVNLSADGSGPWYTIAAPGKVPSPADNYCPNYSTALLPLANGGVIAELASSYNDKGQCVSFLSSETWNSLPTDSTYYAFQNQHVNLCLDDYKGGTANGTPADLWNCTDSNGVIDEYWQVHSQGRGWFTIQSNKGLCLDNGGGSNTPGNKVVVWTCTGNNPNQNWQFRDLANGQFTIWNQAGQLPLDDTGGSLTPGTQLQIWIDNSLDAQHWVLH